ncbi:MAG: NADH-quinone oxidoreductase subunit NuoN [Gammaproteobacteria bacterium]|nr:MAG: NADH-quinone oxidoreductase subunit NuoN [Gammaproteobacteria bacterium]
MNFLPAEFLPALPEIVLAAAICVVLLVDVYLPERLRDITYVLALLGLVLAALAIGEADAGRSVIFSGSYVADELARFLKLIALLAAATAFLYARGYLQANGLFKGEYYLLGLFAVLGIFVMISAASLLTMYLGLEMLSLALYALVAFNRDSPVAAEAAMKYFVLGAIASGCLLYGISIVYGITGTVQFAALAKALETLPADDLTLLAGMALIIVGVAFKFGAVPFHMWLPDVYQGAPLPVTLFVGTVPKLAAFALLLRVLVEGMAPLGDGWQPVLAVLAVVSLALGNIVAIAQSNIKRMLAYSTIAHVGFILLGFATGTRAGMEAALFYTVVYVLMAAGAFGILVLASRDGVEAENIDDLKGLNQRSPWFAAMMLLLMVSMIGVPPLAGFYAKWWILAALLDNGMLGLAIAGVVFSVIGAYYYLRVVKVMYFDPAPAETALAPGWELRLVLSVNALLVLGLGLLPERLISLCAQALG